MKKHHWYYIFVLIIFLAGIFAIFSLNYSKTLQIAIFVLLAMFYVMLGIIHHSLHHTITAKIVIEYIAIATLGISIVVFVLQGM